MFVKPAVPGLVVRDPHSKIPLPAAGASVPDDSSYWQRRLRSGDVVVAEPPAEAPSVEPVEPEVTEPVTGGEGDDDLVQ